MYLSTDQKSAPEYPIGSGFSQSDWQILAGFWHPVAFSCDVQDTPVGARLLDVDLVIYRSRDGICVSRDACPHRGARLTQGWLNAERSCIVCPMHGNHFDHDGRCTLIPSNGKNNARIPDKMRLKTYLSAERYGMIWACLKPTPTRPLPDWPLLEQPGSEWRRIEIPKGHWKASASRQCENFNDIAHLSWVHMKTFGNRDKPQIADYEIQRTSYGIHFEVPYTEVERGYNEDREGERPVRYTHELTYPFATDLRVDYSDTMTSHFFDIPSPINANECAVFQVCLTNIPGAGNDYAAYSIVTNEEDMPLVENQWPSQVPLSPAYEVSVPADNLSIQYRRDMVDLFGLGAPH